ncbi:MAG: DUF2723 domain-containing protein [Lentisphaerae bacterium]|nr:DUF2723 domain-containing protein [Lentisphaerota bacterium]
MSAKESSPFFRRIDWAAFWSGTVISFLVYFFTLGPSVTLEDSGELAVAGDYLGVPHPPGYPIWTMCAWLFARIFSWVTYRGQPTPAWSIALLSAFFGALATGITAMLITRSATDILASIKDNLTRKTRKRDRWFCFAGGLSASLIFAFSPVMWSQATIVEVYTLNAFFLMLIFLLTYHWMRRPTDRVLWVTAFIFGLGLTNYQVLLLAAVPLIIVILLRNVSLFRDFLMALVPFALTAHVLQLGAMPPMPGFNKLGPLTGSAVMVPSARLIVMGLLVIIGGLVSMIVLDRRRRDNVQVGTPFRVIPIIIVAVGMLLLVTAGMVKHPLEVSNDFAPRVQPISYLWVAIAALGAVISAAIAGWNKREHWSDPWVSVPLTICGVFFLAMLIFLGGIPTAQNLVTHAQGVEPFSWGVPTLVFLVGCGLLFVLGAMVPRGIFYAIAVLVIQTALFVLVRKGALLGLTHPTTWWFHAPVWWNFGALVLIWLLLPHGRVVTLSILCAQLGVAFYAYMPLVSDLRNPPMNWGYPRTWEGFKHAITRGQYEKIAPSVAQLNRQLGSYFIDLRIQFTLLLAPLGFLPFAAWRLRTPAWERRKTWVSSMVLLVAAATVWFFSLRPWMPQTVGVLPLGLLLRLAAVCLMVVAIAAAVVAGITVLQAAVGLFAISIPFVIMAVIPQIELVFDITRFDKMLLAGVLILSGVGGMILALTQCEERVTSVWSSGDKSEKTTLVALGVILIAAFFALCTGFMGWSIPYTLLVVVCGVALLVGAVMVYRILVRNNGLRFALDSITQQWLIATVVGFLMMSVLLIVLANPKGDLQDAFIQKVKFISSHGLFALWIGYGLVFALTSFDELLAKVVAWWVGDREARLEKGRELTVVLLVVAVVVSLALAVIPVYRNYHDDMLVFELGGAEQNGHDYGWQFGNYQLRGAAAITEELLADEEPLPNPVYPQEMGPDAVFFGGTDPGRFVPTYMIYSAKVRPDVFLITQNALADNTYMSTMRDLYADHIWMPTPEDSANAFKIYVDEVESGKRPRNAELVIQNGRVQVSGALGVMEINGILCEMIWKNNSFRHDFYIEESYVIPWMYPYLTPHGLIMKLNATKTPLNQGHITADLDFWDWYWRRLTRDQRYRRDVVAQKSFSKLRSAIAGLYVANGRMSEGEQAFQESRILYPPSPEANFRLAQEVLLRQGRTTEALDVMDVFTMHDPNNERGTQFRNSIANYAAVEVRLRELLAVAQKGEPVTTAMTLEIAQCYRDLGSNEQAARVLESLVHAEGLTPRQMLDVSTILAANGRTAAAVKILDRLMVQVRTAPLPSEQYLHIAQAFDQCGEYAKIEAPLMYYLRASQNDWRAWVLLAAAYQHGGQFDRAIAALQRANEIGRGEAMQAAYQRPILRPLLQQAPAQRQSSGLGLPGMKP